MAARDTKIFINDFSWAARMMNFSGYVTSFMRILVRLASFFYLLPVSAVRKQEGEENAADGAGVKKGFQAERFYRAVAAKEAQVLEKGMGQWVNGLTPHKVHKRLKRYGSNYLTNQKQSNILIRFLRTCLNPVVVLLMIIGVILLITGDRIGAIMVVAITSFSVFFTFTQELRSFKAVKSLTKMVRITASVLRRMPNPHAHAASDGESTSDTGMRLDVDVQDIVPGDIVFLSAGDIVPGDMRLLSARDLFVNQSALTGESMPVEKDASVDVHHSSSNLLGLRNICFSGSHVVSGRATGVILRTGQSSYFGSMAASLSAKRPPTRFEKDVNAFTWLLIRLMLIMAPFVFVINGVLKNDWLEAFLFTTTVAVGLTPEMLPMILTVNLAKGAIVMARKKVIVKDLYAIQNFGAIDILCTDKTGTLTQDKVILEHHLDLNGQENRKVLKYTFLNSLYQTGLRNLLDIAVLHYVDVEEAALFEARYQKVDEIPFDFERRRMSVVVSQKEDLVQRESFKAGEDKKGHILIAKGAPEGILSGCSYVEDKGVVTPITEERVKSLNETIEAFNRDGLRVIAVAYKLFPEARATYSLHDENDMVLLGLISFLDPPKESAEEAVSLLRQKGVRVKILTGDNEIVTSSLARHVGLDTKAMTGMQVDALSDEELLECVDDVDIFARLAPLQKERLVMALRQKGHVVGFMGDGINDAPALRAADVGISVDNAVDIAKESANIILLEKNLLVLEEGVIEGRKVFGNIIKYVRMGSSGNFGNILSVTLASILLPFLPILPLQILVQNMLYDFSQAAIPFDSVDKAYVDQPRKWSMKDTRRFMFVMGPISSIFDLVTFGFLWFALGAGNQPSLFQTGWFIESLLSQLMIVHIIRTRSVPFLESVASWPLVLSTLVVAGVGLFLPFSIFAPLFGFVRMPLVYFAGLFVILLLYATMAQSAKTWLLKHTDG